MFVVTPSIVLTDCVEAELAVMVVTGGASLVSEDAVVEVTVGKLVIDPGSAVVVVVADTSLVAELVPELADVEMLDSGPVAETVDVLSVLEVSDVDIPTGIVAFEGVSVEDAELPVSRVPAEETEMFAGGVLVDRASLVVLMTVVELFVKELSPLEIESELRPEEEEIKVPFGAKTGVETLGVAIAVTALEVTADEVLFQTVVESVVEIVVLIKLELEVELQPVLLELAYAVVFHDAIDWPEAKVENVPRRQKRSEIWDAIAPRIKMSVDIFRVKKERNGTLVLNQSEGQTKRA